jgi:hypothetical protein
MASDLSLLGLLLVPGAVSAWVTFRRRVARQRAVRLDHGPFDLSTARPRLDGYINSLVEAFGVDTFSAGPVELPSPSPQDRLGFLRKAVATAVDRFQVTLPTVDLQFAPPGSLRIHSGVIDRRGEIWEAGRGSDGLILERGPGNQDAWRIRIAAEFRINDAAILIVAAHEVAHLVLCREGLEWFHEELVDAAVVLLGYGPLMRRFRNEEQVIWVGGRVGRVICGPGYLHPGAIEYLWTERERLARAAAGTKGLP